MLILWGINLKSPALFNDCHYIFQRNGSYFYCFLHAWVYLININPETLSDLNLMNFKTIILSRYIF